MNLLRKTPVKTPMNPLRKPLLFAAALSLAVLPAARSQMAAAQTPLAARITAPIVSSSRATLAHSRPPLADPAHDLGAVSPSLPLKGMSIVFSRTPQQSAALDALIAAQQDPASAQYHQWLTPDQFAAQFGVADADLAAVSAWLQQQGFTVGTIGRSRNRITFSGTAAQVDSAFAAQLHNFAAPDGSTHFAPSVDISLPAALSGSVLAVENLSSFRLQPRLKLAPRAAVAQSSAQASGVVSPLFTSASTGNHFLTPGDVSVMYDVKAAYSAGYTGVGQAIAIVGQSAVILSDIAAFQAAAGVTAKAPIPVLVPDSGIPALYSGDEGESDLDLEYSSTMAPGAQVYFVYTGDNSGLGVFQSIEYAVDEDIAPIVSASYGGCEVAIGQTTIATLDLFLQQGNAQGQTILSSAGDAGSTDCYGEYTKGSASNYQVAVDYPASSVYATAMGGTEIPVASSAASNSTYFTAASGTDIVTSLKSYVPEQVWNDDVVEASGGSPASGGGGASLYEPRPSWQVGTFAGVALPAGTTRLLPDISLVASNYSAPLLFCTSDSSDWNTTANGGTAPYQVASCNSGFRDASSQDLTAAGGTSFDAPIFAGLLALINQAHQFTGAGNINPTLYTLAANATTYGSAFHDIALGGNQCLSGVSVCGTGAEVTSFAAVTGYDEASGLGSIDLYNLLNAWPTATNSTLVYTTTTVSAASANINLGTTDTLTITVAEYKPNVTLTAVPTGSVTLTLDGTTISPSIPLVNGAATYTYTPTQGGNHVVIATYSGDQLNATSTGRTTVGVTSFTLTASAATITAGRAGTAVLTLTPVGPFTGSVTFFIAGYTSTLTNFCISGSNTVTVANAGQAVPDTLTLDTSATTCTASGLTPFTKPGAGKTTQILPGVVRHAASQPAPLLQGQQNGNRRLPAIAAAACLLLACGLRRRKLLRTGLALGFVLLLSLAGIGLTGCSNSSSSASSTNASNTTAGTYTILIGAQDTATGNAVASATLTITVQ